MGEVKQIAEVLGAGISAPSPISKLHDVSRFTCGKPPLDDFLKLRALKSEGQTARTYVVCSGNSVVGYYSVATGSVQRSAVPKKLQRNTPDHIPIIILARLAVDCRCRQQGIGKALLREAIARAIQVSEIVGVKALMVHAIDDEAMAFYTKYGFQTFPVGSQTPFLPIATLTKAL